MALELMFTFFQRRSANFFTQLFQFFSKLNQVTLLVAAQYLLANLSLRYSVFRICKRADSRR